MRYSQSEKMQIIRIVEESPVSIKQTLLELNINRSTFYKWYRRYQEGGYEALANRYRPPKQFWNAIPPWEKQRVVETALDKFPHPTRAPNELWQTDFTWFKIVHWGWYYLCTILDDYSRYVLAWQLCTGMSTEEVKETIEAAIEFTGVGDPWVMHRPRLLSDNGPCYVSKALKQYLEQEGIAHTRGRPYHSMTQGKIERYHRSMKNILLLENYYSPDELIDQLDLFIQYYNNDRYHEALQNLTPADVYYGRSRDILSRRKRIKKKTMLQRRRYNYSLKVA